MKSAVQTLLLAFILILPAMAGSITPARRFAEALQSYKAGQYASAIEAFEALRSEGYDGFDILYNLGNVYYKNGDVGKSIVSFERALRFDPRNPDALHNLNVVRARTRDRIEPMPLIFFVRWWNELKVSRLPGDFFIMSVLLLWLVAGAAFVFFGFRTRMVRRIALVAGILLATMFAISATLYHSRSLELEERRTAVVMQTQVTVKSAPNKSGIDSFVIHEGLTVEIIGSKQGLLKIRLADGKSGWVQPQSLERI